jgi:hypothetical protein
MQPDATTKAMRTTRGERIKNASFKLEHIVTNLCAINLHLQIIKRINRTIIFNLLEPNLFIDRIWFLLTWPTSMFNMAFGRNHVEIQQERTAI